MLRNYFIITWRNFVRQKEYATAKRIFGEDDPMGKTIKLTGDFIFTVTGVEE